MATAPKIITARPQRPVMIPMMNVTMAKPLLIAQITSLDYDLIAIVAYFFGNFHHPLTFLLGRGMLKKEQMF